VYRTKKAPRRIAGPRINTRPPTRAKRGRAGRFVSVADSSARANSRHEKGPAAHQGYPYYWYPFHRHPSVRPSSTDQQVQAPRICRASGAGSSQRTERCCRRDQLSQAGSKNERERERQKRPRRCLAGHAEASPLWPGSQTLRRPSKSRRELTVCLLPPGRSGRARRDRHATRPGSAPSTGVSTMRSMRPRMISAASVTVSGALSASARRPILLR